MLNAVSALTLVANTPSAATDSSWCASGKPVKLASVGLASASFETDVVPLS